MREEISLFVTYANTLSFIIYNLQLFEANAEKIRQLIILQEAVSEMNASYVLDNHILEILVKSALKIASSEKVLVYFLDIEKVAMAMARLKPHFEKENPVTQLMVNPETGKIKEEVLNQKVLSAIIEIKTKLDRIPEFLQALGEIQKELGTVISVGVASRCLAYGSIPHEAWVRKAGYKLSPNGQTNIGLGRPLFRDTSLFLTLQKPESH